ncbi:MAG: hypothetical protein ACRD2I_15355, partial [Vicinamibacterales bacterium]
VTVRVTSKEHAFAARAHKIACQSLPTITTLLSAAHQQGQYVQVSLIPNLTEKWEDVSRRPR